jgi:dihydroorotase
MTAAPADVLGIEAPSLREGASADIVLFDPECAWVVDPDRFQSKGRNCPFAGRKLRGRAVMTIRSGCIIMTEGSIVEPAATES